MTFGLESRVSRRRALVAGVALLSTLAVTALSGCGGGGDGGNGGGGGGGGTRTVPITGRVMDVGNNLPVPGALVSFNGVTTTTNTEGQFSVAAPPTTGSETVFVQGPADATGAAAYHSTVIYNNRTYGSGRFPIDATDGRGATVGLGDVFIANLSYPPFPPDI
jgi:hypothetical protein